MVLIFHKNKKGNVIYWTLVLFIVLFIFALVNSFAFNFYKDIKPEIDSDINMTEAQDVLNTSYNNFPPLFDSLILFILVGIWAVGLISSFIADEHPAIFGFMMIAVVFTIIAGMFLGNSYEEIMTDTDLSDMPVEFPISYYLLSNMMLIGVGVALLMLIVRFSRNRL